MCRRLGVIAFEVGVPREDMRSRVEDHMLMEELERQVDGGGGTTVGERRSTGAAEGPRTKAWSTGSFMRRPEQRD